MIIFVTCNKVPHMLLGGMVETHHNRQDDVYSALENTRHKHFAGSKCFVVLDS